jgi:eukaryotic-like serine/threonine-protein kinase
MIGKTLSHYTIDSPLGKGGMGEVYRAVDTRLGRSVAIKILADRSSDESESVKRFLVEAKAASALNHPNIVTVHDIGREGALHFIVMEKIDGVPLTARLGEPMPFEIFLDIAIQMTSALAAAHAAGVVHRDIKPANVMLTPSGNVKVVDFGLARVRIEELSAAADDATVRMDARLTRPGVILGTVGYMAPEQIESQRATPRSDVFALGVVFYELLSGRPAFASGTPVSTIASILRDMPPPLTKVRPAIPGRLALLVERCLAKGPAERPATAATVHDELVAIRVAMRAAEPRRLPRRRIAAAAAVLVVSLITASTLWWRHESKLRWVRDSAAAEIEQLLAQEEVVAAWLLAQQALEIAPTDSQMKQVWTNLTIPMTLKSLPPGAEISIRSYGGKGEWVRLGTTPISEVRVPYPLVHYRATLPGHAVVELAREFPDKTFTFLLHSIDRVPEGMVFVQGGQIGFEGTTATVPDFWIDRYEVTNAEYKAFIDAGGYRRPELWKQSFEHDGSVLSREKALALMVDQTGRPGPAGWELGNYPAGHDAHPVEGISWYEAAAYAEFAGRSLPTVFHWRKAAPASGGYSEILTASNFSGGGTTPVGSLHGIGEWGTFDMAGNVAEWCYNSVGEKRYVLGGSWMEVSYKYAAPDAAWPLERRRGIGFRLVRQSEPVTTGLLAPVEPPPPVAISVATDDEFALYARMYEYDPLPLDVRLEESDDSHPAWRKEKVTFTAAYGGERLPAYLFIPKNARPPYQSIVYFPGAHATMVPSSRQLWLRMVEFYIRSGRVVVYPIYKTTYERRVPGNHGPHARRDLRIQYVKDVRRTLDYLESRPDIDPRKIGYYGMSMGATTAAFPLATDRRFAVAVLYGGGLTPGDRSLPEADQHNFLPRVRLPLLMVGGRQDFFFPLETKQKPFFELIGTPAEQKKMVLFEGGHIPLHFNEVIREILTWTDEELGPVALR